MLKTTFLNAYVAQTDKRRKKDRQNHAHEAKTKQHETNRDDDRQTHKDKPRRTTKTHQKPTNDSQTENKDEKSK